MSLSRRRFLVAAPAAGLALAGCAGTAAPRVAVVWSGGELARFRALLRKSPYPDAVAYPTGDNIAASLLGPAGERPDLAIVPRLGLLDELGGRIEPLRACAADDFWPGLIPAAGDGRTAGAWFKLAHKSLIWGRPGIRVPPLGAVEEWSRLRGRVAIGAADGWVLSDWFENVLLAYSPATYRAVAGDAGAKETGTCAPGAGAAPLDESRRAALRGPLFEALTLLSRTWRAALTPEQATRALSVQFHDSIFDVFHRRTADLVLAPEFAWPIVLTTRGKDAATTIRFPGYLRGPEPLVVGGDVVVVLKGDRADAARRLADWLSGAPRRDDPRQEWARPTGFFAPYIGPELVPPVLRAAAEDLHRLRGGEPDYDLSDRLTGPLSGGDGRGMWRILTDLYTSVAIPREVREADIRQAATAAAESMVAGLAGGRP